LDTSGLEYPLVIPGRDVELLDDTEVGGFGLEPAMGVGYMPPAKVEAGGGGFLFDDNFFVNLGAGAFVRFAFTAAEGVVLYTFGEVLAYERLGTGCLRLLEDVTGGGILFVDESPTFEALEDAGRTGRLEDDIPNFVMPGEGGGG